MVGVGLKIHDVLCQALNRLHDHPVEAPEYERRRQHRDEKRQSKNVAGVDKQIFPQRLLRNDYVDNLFLSEAGRACNLNQFVPSRKQRRPCFADHCCRHAVAKIDAVHARRAVGVDLRREDQHSHVILINRYAEDVGGGKQLARNRFIHHLFTRTFQCETYKIGRFNARFEPFNTLLCDRGNHHQKLRK